MTSFDDFKRRIKMRHDFSDQIQVRYHHDDGQTFDTWVSGAEVLARLNSEQKENMLRDLKSLSWKKLLEVKEELPERGKKNVEQQLRDKLAGKLDDFIGDTIIGDGLIEAIATDTVEGESSPGQWEALLQAEKFREKVTELAWIQLEGSLPEGQSSEEHDDWT